MMFKRIYSIHILLATLFFTNGCGGGGSSKVGQPVFTINGALTSTQDIDTVQRNIASNICVALKSKSQNFKTTDFVGTRFIFDVKKNVCGIDSAPTQITSTLILKDDGTLFLMILRKLMYLVIFHKFVPK